MNQGQARAGLDPGFRVVMFVIKTDLSVFLISCPCGHPGGRAVREEGGACREGADGERRGRR